MSARTYLGFLPWIVFAVVAPRLARRRRVGRASPRVLTAAVITSVSARDRSVKELEIFSIALFVSLAVAGALNQHDPQGFLQRYHNGVAVGALALLRGRLARLPAVHRAVRPRARAAEVLEDLALQPGQRRADAHVGGRCSWRSRRRRSRPASFETRLGSTIFNWVLPVGLVVLGVRQATLRWSDQFDGESMGLDAMLNQRELWEAP